MNADGYASLRVISRPDEDPEQQSDHQDAHRKFKSKRSKISSEEYNEIYWRLTSARRRPEYDEHLLRVYELKKELAKKQEAAQQLTQNIREVKPQFEKRRKELLRDLTACETQVSDHSDKIHSFRRGKDDNPPPGPSYLQCVEGKHFLALSSVVIVSNIVTMVQETMDKSNNAKFFWWDQFFMCFYIVELVLKALLWRKMFLFSSKNMWWNWLDLVIVISGVADMYIQPLLIITGVTSGAVTALSSISRCFRFLRLLRILKLVHAFLESDLEWTQQPRFQIFIMSVIGVNSVIMGLETDIPQFAGWFYVEQLFLAIFTFELMVRLKYQSCCSFFRDPNTLVWNYLDSIIVVGGIIDQWAIPTISFVKAAMGLGPSKHGGNIGQIVMLLRMLRLVRLLRLIRLVKNVPPLYDLVIGIVEALHGMGYVLLLTVVFLYACSLICVRLFGHGMVFNGEPPQEVAAIFPNVCQSFFILFKLMNGDGDALEPLFTMLPWTKLFFLLYMVFSTWAILSILTAVVSENMINSTEAGREEREREAEEARRTFAEQKLENLFVSMDKDSSQTLTRQEFFDFLSDPVHFEELRSVSRQRVESADLVYLFNAMKTNADNGDQQSDYIKIADFYKGLSTREDPVKQRAMYRLGKRITNLEFTIRGYMKQMSDILARSDGINGFSHLAVQHFLTSQDLQDACGLLCESSETKLKRHLASFKERASSEL